MSATQAKVIIVWNISGISPVSQVTLKVNTYFVVTGSGRGVWITNQGLNFRTLTKYVTFWRIT